MKFRLTLLKTEDHRIDTISQSCWRRSIFKYMTQVRMAITTTYFGPFHTMAIVGEKQKTFLVDGFKKTGPAAATIKFSIAVKQRAAASGAKVGAGFMMIPVVAAECHFGSFFTGNMVNLWR